MHNTHRSICLYIYYNTLNTCILRLPKEFCKYSEYFLNPRKQQHILPFNELVVTMSLILSPRIQIITSNFRNFFFFYFSTIFGYFSFLS